jgi:chromosome segregation ATPase
LELQALEESRRLEQERVGRERRIREEEDQIAKQVLEQSKKEADAATRDRDIRTKLNTKMQTYLTNYYEEAKKEMISDMRTFRELEKNSSAIDQQLDDVKSSKAMISTQISMLDQQMKDMQEEIEEAKRHEEPPVDDLALPANVHSRQLLELVAKNASITDCLYYLDKGLSKGHIRLDEHIKQVRQLGRQQFMVRAHMQKIIQITSP